MGEGKIQWHPGFVAVVDLELAADRGHLVYEKEYNLNRKPLQIDLLVLKKDRGLRLENEIGRLFESIISWSTSRHRVMCGLRHCLIR